MDLCLDVVDCVAMDLCLDVVDCVANPCLDVIDHVVRRGIMIPRESIEPTDRKDRAGAMRSKGPRDQQGRDGNE